MYYFFHPTLYINAVSSLNVGVTDWLGCLQWFVQITSQFPALPTSTMQAAVPLLTPLRKLLVAKLSGCSSVRVLVHQMTLYLPATLAWLLLVAAVAPANTCATNSADGIKLSSSRSLLYSSSRISALSKCFKCINVKVFSVAVKQLQLHFFH